MGKEMRMIAGLQILSSGFLPFQSGKFISLQYREMPYFSGPLCPPKVKVARHYERIQREDKEMGPIEDFLDSRKLKEAEIETS